MSKPADDFSVDYTYNDAAITLDLTSFSSNGDLSDFMIVENAECPCEDCTVRFTGFPFRVNSEPQEYPTVVELEQDDSNQWLWTVQKCEN